MRPPVISNGAWRELSEAGREALAASWAELRTLPERQACAAFPGKVSALYGISEVFRIRATAEHLMARKARGEDPFPYAFHANADDRLGQLIPLLRDSELAELETMVSWCNNAERDEDREFLLKELNAHLEKLAKRLS